MALFTYWYGDERTTPTSKSNLSIQKEYDVVGLASLMRLAEANIERRFQEGNEAWVLRLENKPVSFGWLGRERARIGELSKVIDIPNGNAYLWNFRTLEPYRGKGYYVHLLSRILDAEEKISERIWVISAPENQSSYNGIVKAGFQPVGDLMFDYKNEVVLMVSSPNERAQAGADLMQVPMVTTAVRPCWRCASKTMNKEASCDCYENNLPCRCNNQNLVPKTMGIKATSKTTLTP